MAESESLLRALYDGYPEERIDHFVEVFQTDATYWGYDGPSFGSPRIQQAQSLIGWLKWALPVLLMMAGSGMIAVGRRHV